MNNKNFIKYIFLVAPLICLSGCDMGGLSFLHEHTFDTEYSFDDSYHWHYANCEHDDLVSGFGPHEFEDGICSICSYVDPASIITYNEEDDSIEGIDTTDLSHLLYAFQKAGNNYTLLNNSHFNEAGLNVYKSDYEKDYSQSTTRLVNENYIYTYSNDENYSSLNEYNKLYLLGDSNSVCYPGEDILTADSCSLEQLEFDNKLPFSLASIDSTYITTNSFERVSLYKYQSQSSAAINDFLNLCCPYLLNDGYYMTYQKVTVEVDNYDNITRIRIYCSLTQEAKLSYPFNKEEFTNWYLMFNESIIHDIGKTSIKCLENK